MYGFTPRNGFVRPLSFAAAAALFSHARNGALHYYGRRCAPGQTFCAAPPLAVSRTAKIFLDFNFARCAPGAAEYCNGGRREARSDTPWVEVARHVNLLVRGASVSSTGTRTSLCHPPKGKPALASPAKNVTVKQTTIKIETVAPTVKKGEDTDIYVTAQAGTDYLDGVKLNATISSTFATASWINGMDETDGGWAELRIHGVLQTNSPGTTLVVGAPQGGTGASDSEPVTVTP